MNRAEALRRLQGTWTYELRDGRVRVRDVNVLGAIEALRREGDHEGPRATTLGQGATLVG